MAEQLVTPLEEKFDHAGRLCRLYARCRELADVVAGQPAFGVKVVSLHERRDPELQETWLCWESSVGTEWPHGSVRVAVRWKLHDDALDRVERELGRAAAAMARARAAASSGA